MHGTIIQGADVGLVGNGTLQLRTATPVDPYFIVLLSLNVSAQWRFTSHMCCGVQNALCVERGLISTNRHSEGEFSSIILGLHGQSILALVKCDHH